MSYKIPGVHKILTNLIVCDSDSNSNIFFYKRLFSSCSGHIPIVANDSLHAITIRLLKMVFSTDNKAKCLLDLSLKYLVYKFNATLKPDAKCRFIEFLSNVIS